MVYQLSYELKTPDKDYAPLYSYLENDLGTSAKHVLRDSWWIAVEHELDVDAICDEIRSRMGEKDNLYFCRLSNLDINGWLPSSIWQWFNQYKN